MKTPTNTSRLSNFTDDTKSSLLFLEKHVKIIVSPFRKRSEIRKPENLSPSQISTLLNPISRHHVRGNVPRAESSASILIPTNGIAVEYILYIVGILVWRDVVTRQFPMTILLCLRVSPTNQPTSQPASVERTRDKSIRGHPANKSVGNDKAVGRNRTRSDRVARYEWVARERLRDAKTAWRTIFLSYLRRWETRREELVKTSIRCQPITYRVYA